jgi:hypothetical protein
MKLNRKHVVTGLVATGLAAGALAGGGVALASASAAPAPATSTPANPSYGTASGYFGGMDGMGAMWSGQQPAMNAAADYLGLSLAQLRTQLQSGNSLADIATAQGKSVPGLKNALLAAMTSRINTNTALTAQQRAAMISQARTHIDTMINMAMPQSPGMGMGMGNGMGSHMTGTDSPMGGMWQ